jgi:hypothetical protein
LAELRDKSQEDETLAHLLYTNGGNLQYTEQWTMYISRKKITEHVDFTVIAIHTECTFCGSNIEYMLAQNSAE